MTRADELLTAALDRCAGDGPVDLDLLMWPPDVHRARELTGRTPILPLR